ncbi:MAG: hypothetical protein EOO15_09520 [Chitinophagaceae bacterium]|nr:MAG: hypothetical protein EOO15_09520 [Chitinophagaceae bacterium]
MRKLIFTALMLAAGSSLFAQKAVDKALENLKNNKIDEARAEIDKAAADSKAAGNADYWFTRARIYSIISRQGADTAAARQALIAMQQYVDIQAGVKDESRQYLSSILENHQTAAGIYNSHLNAGIKNLQGKQYPLAEYHFANALQAFEYLKKAKIISQSFDTTATLYAGYSAESYDNKDAAVRYYAMIADRRVPDTSMIGVYQYLVRYYAGKKDVANKDKYTKIGKELFPSDPWWDAWELQSVQGDKPSKIAQYAEMFRKDPKNMDVAEAYLVELYNYLYKDSPADAARRAQELTAGLQIVVNNNPNDLRWNQIFTQHLSYQNADIESAWKGAKGTKPEEVKKKQDLHKALTASYNELLPQALKTAALYEAKPEMTPTDKNGYKLTINAIMLAYQFQKNTAELAKWDAKLKAIK